MPELPEVEVTRLGFANRIAGAQIRAVRMGKPLRWPLGCDATSLIGRSVTSVRRRGKYLILDLNQGVLLVHLGMSGSLRFEPGWPPQLGEAGPHDHFDLITDLGSLRLHDPRRFGAVVFSHSEQDAPANKLLGGLGLEPLPLGAGQACAFDALALYVGLQRRSTSVKQALLAGDIVVGVGNIYASEALFQARIRPTASANRISRKRVAALHAAIVDVLQRAVAQGGSTLRNFSGVDGGSGHFQLAAAVYGREGLPCPACASPVRMIRQGQRSSYFCARCQRN